MLINAPLCVDGSNHTWYLTGKTRRLCTATGTRDYDTVQFQMYREVKCSICGELRWRG